MVLTLIPWLLQDWELLKLPSISYPAAAVAQSCSQISLWERQPRELGEGLG